MPTALPANVRERRKAKGFTIEKLAFTAGVAVRTVARIEAGEHSPNVSTLAAVATALDTTPAELLAESGSPEQVA